MHESIRQATHEERVRLAQEICDEVKGVLGEDLRAFCIFASVAKAEDVAYSDLEMMAVTTDQYEEHCAEFMRDSIRCQVDFVPFDSVIKQAGKVTTRWPVAADQWHRFQPLYIKDDDDCLEQIKTNTRQVLADDGQFRKATIEMMLILYETVTELQNSFEIRKVKSDAVANLYDLSEETVHLVGLVNRVFYGGMRNAFEDSKKLDNLPPDYKSLIEVVLGEVETDLQTRYNAALELWENIEKWVAEQGIEWMNHDLFYPPKKSQT